MGNNSYETCPVCDSDLSKGVEECTNCGVVLKLFDTEVDLEDGISKEAIEKVKSLVLEKEDDEELAEKIREMDFSPIVSEDEVEEVVTFACPICDSEVGENDSQCPNCGAIFEEEGGEEKTEEEEEIMAVDFQEEIDEYEKRISQFEDSGLDMKYLKEDLGELKDAQNKGDEKKGEKVLKKIDGKIEHIENIVKVKSRCENFLSVLSEKIDVSKLEKKVEKIYEGCKIGEYEVASKRAEEIKKEIVSELDGLEEKGWLKEQIDEKIEETRDLISNIKADVSTEKVEEKIDHAISAKNEGDVGEGLHQAMEALRHGSNILEISEKIEDANEYLEKIRQRDIEDSEYLSSIEDSKRKIETGEKETAFDIIEKCIEDMQSRLEKEEEEDKEELESQELDEKIQEKLPQIESLLEQAEKFDMETNEGENKLDQVKNHAEEEEYEKGYNKLEEIEENYREKMEDEIDEMIDSIKEKSDESLFEKIFPNEKIEEAKEKDKYEKILELIEKTKEELEEEKEISEDLNERISKIENIIHFSENLDFEMEKVKGLLEDTEEKIEDGDFSSAEERIENCQGIVKQKLLDFLKGEIKNAKKKLSNVEDEDVDVTKPIDFLKEANRARKENQLEDGFEALKNYKVEMEKIFENT